MVRQRETPRQLEREVGRTLQEEGLEVCPRTGHGTKGRVDGTERTGLKSMEYEEISENERINGVVTDFNNSKDKYRRSRKKGKE